MLNFNHCNFQGRLPASSYSCTQAALESILEQPGGLDLQDTFSTSNCYDSSLNAMRDLARVLGKPHSKDETGAGPKNPPVDKARPAADLKSMSQAEKYDYYKTLIEENGGKFRSKPGRRNLLSLRRNTNTHANHDQGRYDDVTVMMWKDKLGNKHVRSYRSNTEPSARFEGEYGKDGNGDGRLDQARMKAGYNEYYVSKSERLGNVLRPSRATRGELDINHDGRFNKADGKGRFTSGDYSMLFHAGGETGTGSAGCQTMPPKVFERFWRDLTRGAQGRIGYTIVEMPV